MADDNILFCDIMRKFVESDKQTEAKQELKESLEAFMCHLYVEGDFSYPTTIVVDFGSTCKKEGASRCIILTIEGDRKFYDKVSELIRTCRHTLLSMFKLGEKGTGMYDLIYTREVGFDPNLNSYRHKLIFCYS